MASVAASSSSPREGVVVDNNNILSLDGLKASNNPSVQGQGGGNIYSSELYS